MHQARFSSRTQFANSQSRFNPDYFKTYYYYYYCHYYSLLSYSNASLGQKLPPKNQKHLLSLLPNILIQVCKAVLLTRSVLCTKGLDGSVTVMMKHLSYQRWIWNIYVKFPYRSQVLDLRKKLPGSLLVLWKESNQNLQHIIGKNSKGRGKVTKVTVGELWSVATRIGI